MCSIFSASAKRFWAKGRSREMLRMRVFSLSATRWLNSLTDKAQTWVSRLGKTLSMRVSPLKSASVFVERSVAVN